jgi:tripartite-type tricarboxylate transporter receptor subunit TctC
MAGAAGSFEMLFKKYCSAIPVGLLAALQIAVASAQEYPSRPIRMFVGFAAGGPTDVQARIIVKGLQVQIGQSIVVENRAGAGGNIAADAVAKAETDGYTLLYSSNALSIAPAIYESLPFNVLRDFAPISELAAGPLLLVVHSSVPVHSVDELIALAKQKPGELNYASSGTGTITHLAGAMFARDAGIQVQHVPYKGGAPAVTDLVAGRMQFMMAPIGTVRQFVENGQLRALGLTGSEHLDSLPNVKTISELGIKDFEASAWSGLFAPAATPKPIIDRIQRDAAQVLKKPEVLTKLKQQDLVARGTDPETFRRYLASDIERWMKVAKEAGVRAE